MTQQTINVGTGPDSYTGDPIRVAFQKINSNFTELYAGNVIGNISAGNITATGNVASGGITTGNVTVTGNSFATYFIGNGSLLTGVTATSNYGNANVARYLPTYTGNATASYFVSNSFIVGTSSNEKGRLWMDYANNSIQLGTSAYFDAGNVKLVLVSNPNTFIHLNPVNERIGFSSTDLSYGKFNFNGSVYGTTFLANTEAQLGYMFVSNAGPTGLSHNYEGVTSVIQIQHDSTVAAKFYDTGTTQLIGNLNIVSESTLGNTTFPNALIQVASNVNSYSQHVMQNFNHGSLASSDLVLTSDVGNDSSYFGDFGIASSTYNYPGYGVIKPNDVYLLAVSDDIVGPGSSDSGNLILGTTNGNIVMFVGAPEDANVIARMNTTGFMPGSNVTYSLGSSALQWKDLWLSNSTLYLGGTPITVSNGTLSVNGSVVSGTYSNTNVASYLPTYTGNISANNLSVSNLLEVLYNGNVGLTIDVLNPAATMTAGAGKNVIIGANNANVYWGFDTTGNLTLPDNYTIGPSGSSLLIAAPDTTDGIYMDWASNVSLFMGTGGEQVVQFVNGGNVLTFDSTGNLYVPGSIFVPALASITGTGSPAPSMSGFSSVEASSFLSGGGNVTVRASYGNLRIGDVGNVGSSNAGITSSTMFSIVTDNIGTPHEWVFDANGTLTAPGDITSTSGNILVKNIRTIDGTVYLGQGAGLTNQGTYGIAVGRFAGSQDQGGAGVAVGQLAGQTSQGISAIAIGLYAAADTQSANAVAIGTYAGRYTQGTNSVAVGRLAGNSSQGSSSVAVGASAGASAQGVNSVAVGVAAAETDQGNASTALGWGAGQTNQGDLAVALGSGAAYNGQGYAAIAIGADTSPINQGQFSIAIGAGASTGSFQANNSVLIDATGTGSTPAPNAGLYINPVRNDNTSNSNIVTYNTSSKELTYANTISINGYTVGYRDVPQVTFTSNATLALSDAGKHYFSSNSANVITIPNNTSVSFNIGTAISIIQQGTANLTVTPGSGVTLYLAGNSTSSSRTLGNYGMATLMKVGTNTWFINGTGVN